MTAISPCFFTHYAKPGSTPSGEWEWGKNWVYGMDDLGVVRRWEKFIDLAQSGQQGGQAGDEAGCGKGLGVGPDIVQIVSWNDCGESHYICPTILGCQPGSEGWVDGMPHAALGEVCAWMAGRWRDGDGEVDSLYRGKAGGQAQTAGGVYDEVEAAPQGDVGIQEPESRLGHTGKVWMWYRIHSAKMDAADDERGRPEHTDRAKDLINVVVLLPRIASTLGTGAGDCDSLLSSGGSPEHSGTGDLELVLNNAEYEHVEPLVRGKANLFTIPFVPGPVRISIRNTDHANNGEAIWEAEGRGIDAVVDKWNYNFWSGSWDVDV